MNRYADNLSIVSFFRFKENEMKFAIALIVTAMMVMVSADQASAQCCCDGPVRKVLRGVASVPGQVIDRWQEVQPIRRIASVPGRVADRWREVQPIRRVASLPGRAVNRWMEVKPVRRMWRRAWSCGCCN